MSDFELSYLFSETVGLMQAMYTNFFSFIFAGLVASTLAADRMSRSMVILAISVFSLIELIFMQQIYRASITFSQLAERLKEAAQEPGNDITWHGVTQAPGWLISIAPVATVVIIGLCYFGVIYFFFLCRRGGFKLARV